MKKRPFATLFFAAHLLAMVTFGQVTDVKGKVYATVWVENDSWMAENLSVTQFNNGDPLLHCTSLEAWEKACNAKKPAWCFYQFDPALGQKHGILYNGYAVTDKRGLAPKGWRIPKKEDWDRMILSLGGKIEATRSLKTLMDWDPEGTDASGFSGLPSGMLTVDGSFDYLGEGAYWWTSSQSPGAQPLLENVSLPAKDFYIDFGTASMHLGLSIRCIKTP